MTATENRVKYTSVCQTCSDEGAHNNIFWSQDRGYHCDGGHEFADSVGTPKGSSKPEPLREKVPLDDPPQERGYDLRPAPGSQEEAVLMAELEPREGHEQKPSAKLHSVALDAFELVADDKRELILPSGDLLIGITIPFDHIGHLRGEAETQSIPLVEHIQRKVNEAVENGWW